MNGLIRFFILTALIASLTSCASQPTSDDMALDELDTMEETVADSSADKGFSEFDEDPSVDNAAPKVADNDSDLKLDGDSDSTIEQELNAANGEGDQDLVLEDDPQSAPADQSASKENIAQNDVSAGEEDPFASDFADESAPAIDESLADVPQPSIVDPAAPADVPAPSIVESTPSVPIEDPFAADPIPAPVATMGVANITDLQFRANDNGGTIIIKADKHVEYVTRSNPDLNQFIIEVPNAILPSRLKRSLNTKDIQGSIGALDAYQNAGSTTARFVIQLRPGVLEPAVQMEGNQLLIVANTNSGPAPIVTEAESAATDADSDKILPASDLTEFIAGNTKFYGKKISLETANMDVQDALRFITEESGVNMVISEEVKGNVSLKLRQVPWDQALVVLMQAKKLGYARQGNVLRIAPLTDLKAEEEDANKLALSKRVVEPLRVRMFPVSYARVEDLEKKVKDFLGERGKVVGDIRTNSLVVTDIADNLERASRVIASLDTQPPQVQIEAKIIEAQESFSRSVGVAWGTSGANIRIGSSPQGPVNLRPSLGVNQGALAAASNMRLDLNVGTLDFLGTLNASLALSENEDKVKVLSSPRILTMSNEKADINQTTEVPVRTTTMTQAGPQYAYQFKAMALKLEVTPQVTADGSVIMKVSVGRQFPGATQTVGEEQTFSVNSREANTRVLVRNGQTAVIGGIYTSDATEQEIGVPLLRKIPILGSLFSVSNKKNDKSELLVFLTPRIINAFDPTSSMATSDESVKDNTQN